MKKFIGLSLFAVLAFCLVSIGSQAPVAVAGELIPTPEPAQVIYSKKCCDSDAVVRCYLINWTPVGNACFCPGQGYGYAC